MLLSCRLHRRAPAVSALLAYPGSLGSRRGAPALALQSRSFRFWGSGKGDSDKDKEGAGSDNASTIEAEKTSVSGELITPATIGTGDHAPRYPKLIGLPVLRRPLFPGTIHPYNVTNPDVLSAIVKSKEEGQPYLGVFLRKDASVEHGTAFGLGSSHDSTGSDAEVISSLDEIYGVGTFAQVYQVIPGTVGTGSQVLLLAHRRLSIKKVHTFGPPLEVEVEHWARGDASPDSDVIKAYCQEIVATIRDVVRLNPLLREHMAFFSQRIDIQDPYKLADFAAAMTTADSHELQQVLEEMNVKERLRMALELISKERELSKVQQEIQKQVEEKVSKTQRTFLLQEQLKSIRKELGMEKDDKEALLNTYRERMASFTEVNKDAERAMKEEIEKLESLEKNSQEFNGTRTYLDWLTSLPWGRTSEENFDLARAKDILNREHYGLDDVKRRILEFIAVGKLRGGVHGRILCFVGPPGVGKTSINQSIARALNREFYRFSVGGLTDVASIKGHRRTYVGSQPGKMIQCLKTTGTNNPLVLIDEIDKLGKGYQGDPASALLEVLDPSQNDAFVDHYLDVPVDLSQCLFICTANVLDTIPAPLLDRMEVIRISGYDLPEKVSISEQYLIPKVTEEHGLRSKGPKDSDGQEQAIISQDAIKALIRGYCREAGVRNLEKHLSKIARKLALAVVQHDEMKEDESMKLVWPVTSTDLPDFVGKPVHTSDILYEEGTPPGVVMGLAWTALGGATLYIETSAIMASQEAGSKSATGGGSLRCTGQLGSVMQESAEIAHHFARRHLLRHDPANTFFERARIHMHIPEGATPKDGPSAGITMVTSLLSLAMERSIASDIAMSGEVSLNGKVLPVGGIKEKVIAARRDGAHRLIFPVGNRRDFDELPEYLKQGLVVHYASQYDEVFQVAFPPPTPFPASQ